MSPTEIAEGQTLKRQKRVRKEKKVSPNRCEFYIEQKRRQCAMQRKKGHRFCSEHMIHDESSAALEVKGERVPCPLDPKHTVWLQDLDQHLKKCNAKPKDHHDSWYVKNFNTKYGEDDKVTKEETKPPGPADFEKLTSIIKAYQANREPLKHKESSHSGLDSWLEEKENQKHILQQLSLVGNMKENGLLSTSATYIEFGCGKAELSRAVNACNLHDDTDLKETYGFGLIDRGTNRMKMDSKIIKDCQDKETKLLPKIKRSRIDIEHLQLDNFLESEKPDQIVCISKHLCGVATDLTLKLLLHSSLLLDGKFHGLLVAMCCRHVCHYSQLLPESRNYLTQHGVTNEQDFVTLRRMVTWAVCGNRGETTTAHESGLLSSEREELGLAARRMIDESRVHAAQKAMPQYNVELFKYTDKSITLENSCICITKKH